MEDRKDLLTLLMDGLEADEREHVRQAILLTTARKYERLQREYATADSGETDSD